MHVALPFPPSVNTYWRTFRGRMIISAKGREYRQHVCKLLEGCERMTGRLSLMVELFPPDRRRRDIDNSLKALLDGLGHGGAYDDDSQIKLLQVAMMEPTEGGEAVVKIERMGA